MTKPRFSPWVVFACIGALAGCTSSEDGTAGNTQLNVVIPNGAGNGSTAPAAFDIQVVEYTIACAADPATSIPGIDSIEPTYDPDVTISGVLEVLDSAAPGVTTQDFGPDLGEVYVFQGYMDIPLEADCTAQLRARDGDGEVICTSTEAFNTNPPFVAGDTVTVNILMYCGISYQAPVAMLDLNGDFSFNIANFCPSLYVLNCIDSEIDIRTFPPPIGAVAATACQVRAKDGDSQCGNSCDPQTCVADAEGLTCTPAPEPATGLKTTVVCPPVYRCAIPNPAFFGTPCTPGDATPGSCNAIGGPAACVPNAVIDCTGTNTPAANCTYNGDVLGTIGAGPPGPLAPGAGGFFVACVLADNDGNAATPKVPVSPGATVTCTATTTDGDTDCDKVKTVEVTCPGLTPCQAFIAGGGSCSDGSICTTDSCNDATCDGTAANCCQYADANEGVDCSAEVPPFSICTGGVCTSQACLTDADCETPAECTFAGPGICNVATGACGPLSNSSNTTLCNAGGGAGSGTCNGTGTCVDNCASTVCSDSNPCTDSPACVSIGGPTCPPPVNDDTNTCTTCGGPSCLCSAGSCIAGCTVPAEQDAPGIPMACRNSFNQVVSTFPIDLLNVNTNGACIEAGQAVDFTIDPVIALDTAFLQAAAQTLCDLGTFLTSADVTSAQVSMDAIAGATCTEQRSVLSPVPQTVTLDITLVGSCGSGGIVTVNSGISLPLPQTTLANCIPGAVGSEVQICSTGQVPLAISLTNPTPPPTYQDTYVGVAVGGGAIQVAFACNTSSTTNPAPGQANDIGCVLANPSPSTPAGLSCGVQVGTGNVGQTPFPTSNCNVADGPPTTPQTCLLFGTTAVPCSGTCDTVPVRVDPSTVCATFPVQ